MEKVFSSIEEAKIFLEDPDIFFHVGEKRFTKKTMLRSGEEKMGFRVITEREEHGQ